MTDPLERVARAKTLVRDACLTPVHYSAVRNLVAACAEMPADRRTAFLVLATELDAAELEATGTPSG